MSHHLVREGEQDGFQLGTGLDRGAAALAAHTWPMPDWRTPPNGAFGSSCSYLASETIGFD